MEFKIIEIDKFINECKTSCKEITYVNFTPINENLATDIKIPEDVFEAYLKYSDVSGVDMPTLLEFEKIKSFSEFIEDKKSENGDSSISSDSDEPKEDGGTEEPKTEEPKAEETPSVEEPKTEEPKAEESPETEEPKEEPKDDESSEEPKDDEEKEDDTLDVKVENVVSEASSVSTPPENVSAQAEAKGDDASQQTKVNLETGDGSTTAKKIEDTIVKLGTPEKKNDSEGSKLVGEATASVQTQPEDVKPIKGEGSDASASADVPTETGNGSATAKKIEDTIVKLGTAEELSTKEGEKLIGESEEDQKKTLK